MYKILQSFWTPPSNRKVPMKLPLSICQYVSRSVGITSVNRFSQYGSQGFSEISHEVRGLPWSKTDKAKFQISRKNSRFAEKAQQFFQNSFFSGFCQKYILLGLVYLKNACLTLKVHSRVVCEYGKTTCLGKIWVFSCGLKCSQPI